METHEIVAAIEEMNTKALSALVDLRGEVKTLKASQAAEIKFREALELKLGRMSLSGNSAPAGAIDPVALAAEHKAMGAFARSDGNGDAAEMKALSTGSDPDGGYLVLPMRSATMTARLFEESPIRRLARVVTMPTGDVFEEPVDIEEAEAIWVGETQSRAATTTPEVKMLRIPLHEVYANPKATQKILDTSYIDVGAWLDGKINDRFGRSDALAFVSGTGILKPTGFLTQSVATTADAARAWGTLQYTKTGHASAFPAANPADVLKTLTWSLRAPYRRGAVWVMNSQTASVIDKFKDGTGNYIWRDAMTAGSQPSLLGYPVEFDENMPDIGADAFPIAFGNFKLGYTIVERPGLKMLRDPYTDKPNVMFYAYRRVGGDVSNTDAIKLLKCEA